VDVNIFTNNNNAVQLYNLIINPSRCTLVWCLRVSPCVFSADNWESHNFCAFTLLYRFCYVK